MHNYRPEALAAYKTDFVTRVAGGECSLLHRVVAAKCVLLFDPAATQQASALVTAEQVWTERGLTLKQCVAAHQMMSTDLGALGVADSFKAQIIARYPLSNFSGQAASANFTGVPMVESGELTE